MKYLKHSHKNTEEWDKYITLAMKAYNTSGQEGTEYAHELIFGRSARVPTCPSILPDDKGNESYPECATALFKQILTLKHQHARTCKN